MCTPSERDRLVQLENSKSSNNTVLQLNFFKTECPLLFLPQLDKFKNMIPFDQMTIGDLNETFPETKLDKQKHPYWPHKPIAEL